MFINNLLPLGLFPSLQTINSFFNIIISCRKIQLNTKIHFVPAPGRSAAPEDAFSSSFLIVPGEIVVYPTVCLLGCGAVIPSGGFSRSAPMGPSPRPSTQQLTRSVRAARGAQSCVVGPVVPASVLQRHK